MLQRIKRWWVDDDKDAASDHKDKPTRRRRGSRSGSPSRDDDSDESEKNSTKTSDQDDRSDVKQARASQHHTRTRHNQRHKTQRALERRVKFEQDLRLRVDQHLEENKARPSKDYTKFPKIGQGFQSGTCITTAWVFFRFLAYFSLLLWGLRLATFDDNIRTCVVGTYGSQQTYCMSTYARGFAPSSAADTLSTNTFMFCLSSDDSRCNCDIDAPVSDREGCTLNFTFVNGVETTAGAGTCRTFVDFFDICRDRSTCPPAAQNAIRTGVILETLSFAALAVPAGVATYGFNEYKSAHPSRFFEAMSRRDQIAFNCAKAHRFLAQIALCVFLVATSFLTYVVEFVGVECKEAQTTTGGDWSLNEDASRLAFVANGITVFMLVGGTALYMSTDTRGELHWPSEQGTTECTNPTISTYCCCVPCRDRSSREFRICAWIDACICKPVRCCKGCVRAMINLMFRLTCEVWGVCCEALYRYRHYISV